MHLPGRAADVWLGASTRDVGVRISLWNKEITHRVEPDIDVERERIVRDLGLGRMHRIRSRGTAPCNARDLSNATGDRLQTDGAVAVVELKNCNAPDFADGSPQTALLARPPSKLARYARAQVLSFRDLWRENAAYNAFDISRMAVRSWRRNHDLCGRQTHFRFRIFSFRRLNSRNNEKENSA